MNVYQLKRALNYYLFARHKNGHGIHSPFLFKVITEVFQNKSERQNFDVILNYRKSLKRNKRKIILTDLGSSSIKNKQKKKSIRDIHIGSSTSKKFGELLYRLTKFSEAKVILETGTCFGVSAGYMALASDKSTIHTIEADPIKCKIANTFFETAKFENISIYQDSIDEILPVILKKVKYLDFVFLDANHTYIALKKYFDLIVKHIHNDSIIVIDDIHWSKEMRNAWNEIRLNKEVTLSIDLFQFGILFFRKESQKQHFIIKY